MFPLEIMEGQMGKSTYAMGVVASIHLRTKRERADLILAILVRTYQLNDPFL